MQRIPAPKEIENTYGVAVPKNAAAELAAVRIDGRIAPARVRMLRKGKETAELSITIHEGKKTARSGGCVQRSGCTSSLRRVRSMTADEVRAFEQEK